MSVPKYALDAVKTIARRHDIEYRGRVVQRDINHLGYELVDVARCLTQLSESDFSKSVCYEQRPTDDIYICAFTKAGNAEAKPDDLYVKFCLIGNCLVVDFAAFHLGRF